MGWGKFPAGGVKGGKHFYPGVKSPLSIVAAQAADSMAIGKLRILFGETSDFCQKVWFCQIV